MSLAFGEVKILPNDFYKMSWKEFFLTIKGYYKSYWSGWEQTRMIAYTVACTTQTKKNKLPTITKWFPLPTDKKTIDVEKMDLVWNKLKQRNGERNKSKDSRRGSRPIKKRKQG